MSAEIPYPMTHHYQELSGTSDWLCCMGNLPQPIRTTTQISILTYHQYGISMLVSQMSFCRETSGGIVKCQLFSQAMNALDCEQFLSLVPREQTLHFRCVSCCAKSSLCRQLFNFLPSMREIYDAIREQN